MTKRAIAIFAKPPVPGQTKSRLAKDTSPEFAAALSGAMLEDLAQESLGAGADVILYYPPGVDVSAFGDLLKRLSDRAEQAGTGLGERMDNCFKTLLDKGYDQVIIIGSDCISQSAQTLAEAFAYMSEHDLVIQPADDGGYVLIGLSEPVSRIFKDIDWGSERVMIQTRAAVSASGLSCKELAESFDIDTVTDLPRLNEFLRNHHRPSTKTVLDTYQTDL